MENQTKRLVIRYEQGQNSFGGINPMATPPQLHRMAMGINSAQAVEAKEVDVVTITAFN